MMYECMGVQQTIHQKGQASQAQGYYCMGMSIHMNKGYYKLPLANIQTTSSLSNQLKAHAPNLSSSIVGTCVNHNSMLQVSKKGDNRLSGGFMKLSTTFLLPSRSDSQVNQVEKHKEVELHKQEQKIDINFRDAYMEFSTFKNNNH